MMSDNDVRRNLYVEELKSARKTERERLENRTFFCSFWTVKEEVDFAIYKHKEVIKCTTR